MKGITIVLVLCMLSNHIIATVVPCKAGNNCTTCDSDENTCTACVDGYTLEGGTACIKCDDLCLTCDTTAKAKCLTCVDGKILDADTCKVCSEQATLENCTKCSSVTQCTECPEFFLLEADKCVACSKDCKICSKKARRILKQKSFETGISSYAQFQHHNTVETECTVCSPKFVVNKTTKTCDPCPKLCEVCTDKDTCKTCEKEIVLRDGKCSIPCYLDNCRACSDPKTCIECRDGFYKNSKNECIPCSKNCITCEVADVCLICSEETIIKNGKCEDKCPPAYFFDGKICLNCKKGCKECKDDKTCKECYDSLILEGTECKECVPGCTKCKDSKTCETCRPGLVFNSTDVKCSFPCKSGTYFEDSICKDCDNNCRRCSKKDACEICKDGFFVNASKKCERCMDGCEQCTEKTKCLACHKKMKLDKDTNVCKVQCKNGYFINSLGICEKCGKGCRTCTSGTVCLICRDSYFKSSNKCEKCAKRCKSCTNKESCIFCAHGLVFNKKNKICDTTICNKGHYLQDGFCYKCKNGCKTCTSATDCTSCIAATQLEGTKCNKCKPGCIFCKGSQCQTCPNAMELSTDKTSCIFKKCPKGEFYHITTGCTKCKNNCRKCNNANNCFKCNYGFKLINNVCSSCTLGCLKCTIDKCEKCVNGFQLSFDNKSCELTQSKEGEFTEGGVIKKCPANCAKCSNTYKCDECKDVFILQNNVCKACTDGCLKCDSSNCLTCVNGLTLTKEKTCSTLKCKEGYFFDNATNTCKLCKANCKLCTNFNICNLCFPSYFNRNGSCFGCPPGCLTCNNENSCTRCTRGLNFDTVSKSCKVCSLGQYNDNGICRNCMTNCNKCSNSYSCSYCSYGYFLQFNKCKLCLSGCVSCTSNSNCNKCARGLFYDSGIGICKYATDCVNGTYYSNGTCMSCIANCKQCTNTHSCNVCNSGFVYDSVSRICKGVTARAITLEKSACSIGQYFNGESCKTCAPGCTACKSGVTCTTCQPGSIWNFSTFTCNPCQSGTYPRNGICANCVPGCTSCTNGSSCQECGLISGKIALYHSASKKCQTCQTLFGVCESCINNTCTVRCPSGLNFENNSCLKTSESDFEWNKLWKVVGIVAGGLALLGILGAIFYLLSNSTDKNAVSYNELTELQNNQMFQNHQMKNQNTVLGQQPNLNIQNSQGFLPGSM